MGKLLREYLDRISFAPTERQVKTKAEDITFISSPSYKRLKEYLHGEYESSKPVPGKEHAVNYLIGLNNGISLVLNYLNRMENAVKEESNE